MRLAFVNKELEKKNGLLARQITELKEAEEINKKLIEELKETLSKVKTLSGLLLFSKVVEVDYPGRVFMDHCFKKGFCSKLQGICSVEDK